MAEIRKAVRAGQFVKGDPRINKSGNKSADAQKWAIAFRECLVQKLPVEKAADVLIKAFERAQPWAVQEVLDRLLGKAPQAVQHSGEIKTNDPLIIKVVHVKGGDAGPGNGNGGNGGGAK